MRSGLVLCLLLLGALQASAAESDVRAEITRFGLYDFKVTSKRTEAGTATGYVQTGDYEFHTTTTTVPARLGAHFGFEYVLIGTPKGAKINVRKVVIFPQGGLTNPKTGKTVARNEYEDTIAIGDRGLRGYSLDEDWEAVPGTWTLQLWLGDRKLAEKSFTLTRPQLPGAAR